MVRLGRALDESTSLREVVRRLTADGVPRPTFSGRGGSTSSWSITTLRYMLKNPIYTGTSVFGRFGVTRGRSPAWNKFALDDDGAVREFVHHIPELAYWEPAAYGAGSGSSVKGPEATLTLTGFGPTHTHLPASLSAGVAGRS
jgi:hypothetical protein